MPQIALAVDDRILLRKTAAICLRKDTDEGEGYFTVNKRLGGDNAETVSAGL